jgi:hypothetical protein
MHYVNKVKSYLNFYVNNLKLLKNQIIFVNEQHSERNIYEQY